MTLIVYHMMYCTPQRVRETMAKVDDDIIYRFKNGWQHVYVYPNRIEIRTPRAATLWLTKKTETIYISKIRDVSRKPKYVRIHLGAASVRQINGKRKDIDALMDVINAAM